VKFEHQASRPGARSSRGLAGAQAEISLATMVYNLKTHAASAGRKPVASCAGVLTIAFVARKSQKAKKRCPEPPNTASSSSRLEQPVS
jgi:hypothetical protein